MKKFIILLVAVMGSFLIATAHPVSQEMAKMVASRFMRTNDLQLVSAYKTDKNVTAFYIFNTTDGFVIVSADDCETPIIGYSREGRFDPNNVPVQMEDYLDDFAARIQYGAENHIGADEATARQWESVKTTGKLGNNKDAKSVAPLLTAKWNQGCLYNSLCPTMEGAACGHASVGCVAVAMGQIMHYWGYPASGWGAHSYNNSGASLSADFGNTTYDWSHMPDSLTEASTEAEIEAVATLLYHCGIAVEMMYTPSGSGANSSVVPNALYRYFDYSRQAHWKKKSTFDNEVWMSMLKHNLDLQRPVLYSGSNNKGSHAFVCDGYDANDLLHFNWGWGGDANGYFALGHLNPNGFEYNSNNYAIFDIIPQYDPCIVTITTNPPTAGNTEGAGEYHIGEKCTITAMPTDNYDLYLWKRNGQPIGDELSYSFTVENPSYAFETVFSLQPVGQVSANHTPDANNPNSPSITLSWNHADSEWHLLKQIETGEECSGVATDGQHIFVTYAGWNNPPFNFGKYTMDGDLVEQFNLRDSFGAVGLGYDGNSFYCTSSQTAYKVMFRIDPYNKTILDSINYRKTFGDMTYDPGHDGFWLGFNNNTSLYDRQGHWIKSSPTLPEFIYGAGYFEAKDGNPHLLLTKENGVFDYDISNDIITHQPLMDPGWDYTHGIGANVAKYDGKDALYVNIGHAVCIYEINCHLEQIVGYRIYRADSEGNMVMLADGIGGSSYTDTSWGDVAPGDYRFGISSIFANGVESDIVWSDTVVKSGIGIGENPIDPTLPSVQKIIENGHIVIIKDGKRYSLTGQILK